jgi:hypothetical protein
MNEEERLARFPSRVDCRGREKKKEHFIQMKKLMTVLLGLSLSLGVVAASDDKHKDDKKHEEKKDHKDDKKKH